MNMLSQQMILGSKAFNITTRATDRYHIQPASTVSGLRKQSIPQPYDPFTDLESTRLMEERYGIKEEGLF